jgi:hypothetical protein
MGTGETSTCPETDQQVPENQIFPKEQYGHQLPISLGDPAKNESPETTLGLLILT